ncbi:MAG: hypothetical protein ACD_79C00607G0003 [uncultured bacterium]|nr:MAG: hypothetical protein ACD_79C00607G0003 [uncultured bacterium]
MSYNLIKKINSQLLDEVPKFIFPFQYGTIGSFLVSIMIPVYGTEAINMVTKEFDNDELNFDEGNIADLKDYIKGLDNSEISSVFDLVMQYIEKEFYGDLKSFFHGDVWLIDSQISPMLTGRDEFRDSLLLFVFSVPVFPVSIKLQDIMIDFHIFEPDDSYLEMQAILNEYFSETPKCQRSYLAWKYLDSIKEDHYLKILTRIDDLVPFNCDGCGKDIKGLKSPFITRIEVYPSRTLRFEQEDLDEKDFEKEITAILETAGQKSEKELNRSVWTEYRLFLCSKCRNTFVKRIDHGEFI